MTKKLSILGIVAIAMFFGVLSAPAADTNAKPTKVTMKGTPGTPVKTFNANVKAAKRYKIAIVVKSQAIPVWESHLIAAAKAGRAMGVDVMQYAPSKADNVEEQKRILEDLVTKRVG